ncbi:MAG: hypothetical protein QXG39_04950 [Candidatus Aenigmatarchaeota archaeon]
MKSLNFLTLFIIFIFACARSYIKTGNFSEKFNKELNYKVCILPPVISPSDILISNPLLFERTYNKLITRFSEVKKFNLIDKYVVMDLCKRHEFGQLGYIDPVEGKEIATELGADLVVICELGASPPPGGGLPFYANVIIIDVKSGETVYTGSGRCANPLSAEAGLELAIQLATEKILKEMK